MTSDNLIQIPDDIQIEIETIIEEIKNVALKEGLDTDEIKVIKPSSINLTEGEVVKIVLYIGSGVFTWLTDKWLETYVWPIIKKKNRRQKQKSSEMVFSDYQ